MRQALQPRGLHLLAWYEYVLTQALDRLAASPFLLGVTFNKLELVLVFPLSLGRGSEGQDVRCSAADRVIAHMAST